MITMAVQITLATVGFFALVLGIIPLSTTKVAQGAVARFAGILLMLPFPLAYALRLLLAASLPGTSPPLDPQTLYVADPLINLGSTVGCLVLAAIITMLGAREEEEEEDLPALRRRYQKWADRTHTAGRDRSRVPRGGWGGEEKPAGSSSVDRSDTSEEEEIPMVVPADEVTPEGKPAVTSEEAPREGIQAEPRPRLPILDVLPVQESVPESPRRRKPANRGRLKARDSSRFWVELGVVLMCVFLLIGGAAFLWWSVRPFLPEQPKVARNPASFVDPARTPPLPGPAPIQPNPQDQPPIFPRPQNFQPANPLPNPVAQAPLNPMRRGQRFHPTAVPGPKLDNVRFLPLQAQDLVYDPVRGHLYAAVGSKAKDKANTVTALDPATGNVVWSLKVGSDPAVLALSDDASTLWVALDGAAGIQRIDVDQRQAGPLVPFRVGFDNVGAETLAAVPGSSEAVVASLYTKGVSPRCAGVVVVEKGWARPALSLPAYSVNRLAYSDDAGTLYGLDNESTGALCRLEVTEKGVRRVESYRASLPGSYDQDITFADGRLYSTRGKVVDAATGILVGTLSAQGPVTVDVLHHRAYFLEGDRVQTKIEAFDTTTLTPRSSYSLPRMTSGTYSFVKPRPRLVQVGGTALAYNAEQQVVLVPLQNLEAGSPAQSPGSEKSGLVQVPALAPRPSESSGLPPASVKPPPGPVAVKSSPPAPPLLPTISADQLPKVTIDAEPKGVPVLQSSQSTPLTVDKNPTSRVVPLPDQERCLVGGQGNAIEVWNYHTAKRERRLTFPYNEPQPRAVTPDGTQLLLETKDFMPRPYPLVIAWDLGSGKELWRTPAYPGSLREVFLSPDAGRVLVWTAELQPPGPRVAVYDLLTGTSKGWFREVDQYAVLEALGWYSDNRQVLLARRAPGKDNVTVSLRKPENSQEVRYVDLEPNPALVKDLDLAVLPSKNLIVFRIGPDLLLMDSAKGAVLTKVRMSTLPLKGLAVSEDGRRILCPAQRWQSGKDPVYLLHILNAQTGTEVCRLTSSSPFHSAVFTPDGNGVLANNQGISFWPLPQ
ncbi:MAG: hypothetical protein JO112_03875 [Planctomycetes bacterium]|nr:hypothetical protein [Planctomycetota bacterium]